MILPSKAIVSSFPTSCNLVQSQVKLEQDLELKRQEEEAAFLHKFKAKDIPRAVSEPRFQGIVDEQMRRREEAQEVNFAQLKSMERPFSFYYRDMEKRAVAEEERQRQLDPNRFQQQMKTRPIPAAVYEERYRLQVLQLEARRAESRIRAEIAREKARQKYQGMIAER